MRQKNPILGLIAKRKIKGRIKKPKNFSNIPWDRETAYWKKVRKKEFLRVKFRLIRDGSDKLEGETELVWMENEYLERGRGTLLAVKRRWRLLSQPDVVALILMTDLPIFYLFFLLSYVLPDILKPNNCYYSIAFLFYCFFSSSFSFFIFEPSILVAGGLTFDFETMPWLGPKPNLFFFQIIKT